MSRKKKGSKLDLQEDVYDEIDSFHLQNDNDILFGIGGRSQNKFMQKEVLSVQVEGEDEDDFENPETLTLYQNNWGKKRRDFYGTSYVDKDFGGVRDSDEEEMLDLEEEDAIVRQKRLDSANNYVNMADFDQVLDWESDSQDEDEKLGKEKKKREVQASRYSEKLESQSLSLSDQTNLLPPAHLPLPSSGVLKKDSQENKEGKRGISYEMQNNRGLTVKRKRGTQHSRIKKRLQYDKALIRRRSQVPDVRRELTKYDGEKRGIRASTIRSIKLQ